jgi:catechol 2,3-dioxygenase-like lactoylglutathione lyase family enzyme
MIPSRASVITLGARDIDALRAFYRGLGWKAVVDMEGFAAFELRGAVLALFPLDELAADARVPAAPTEPGMRGFSIAINVDRREQVDEAIAEVRKAGGRVTKEPVDMEWGGRSAYFADPEDNFWEVAWVPPESNMARALEQASGITPV